MLDASLKEQLKTLFRALEADYVFDIKVRAGHKSRTDLLELLEDTASCSDKLSCRIAEGESLEFHLLKDGEDTGVCFKAVPGGHEFSSLILAILNADGKGKNLPDTVTLNRLKRLQGNIQLTTYMSLSCTNCPDVVQALNLMALLNPQIKHTAIDGALFPEESDRLKIQAVPTVFLGKERLHIGRSSFGELLEKLEANTETTDINDNTPITRHFDILIAGGGPAGASAAIYSARKGLKVALIAEQIGGQVNETVGIENLISVAYTTGKDLAGNLRKHLEEYHIDIYDNRKIEECIVEGNEKILRTKGGEEFRAPSLIIATGASWRKLNVPGETEYIGRGVAFCPHCDGPFYKGKKVAVIGGGNSGVEAAIDLAGICSEVTVIEFMDNLKADTVLQHKLRTLSNVKVLTSTQTLEMIGDGNSMNALRLKNRENGEEMQMPFDGVFIQIGLSANSELFKEIVEVNRAGEILTDRNCRTSVPGIYAAGDVSDVAYKQIIISMGEGAKAALSAFEDKIRS